MAATSGVIRGDLNGVDYGDNVDRVLEPGEYAYTIKAGGRGKLAFKVQNRDYPNLGESGRARWVISEKKSKIRGGTTLTGDFYAYSNLSVAEVRFNFNRELFSNKVDYELTFEKKA